MVTITNKRISSVPHETPGALQSTFIILGLYKSFTHLKKNLDRNNDNYLIYYLIS